MVASTATHLGMNVIGYDPYLTVEGAWSLSRNVKRRSHTTKYLSKPTISRCVPATAETKNNDLCQDDCRDERRRAHYKPCPRRPGQREDIIEALASGKVSAYVTDFPTDEIVGVDGVATIPHLGASTEEAEDNCAVMAANELDDYLRLGNITNSVNFPNVSMPKSGDTRICVLHANVPALISQITTALSEQNINIENMINKSKGDNAYTMVDVSGKVPEDVIEKIKAIAEVTRVRVI